MSLDVKMLQKLCEAVVRDAKAYNEGKIPKAMDEDWSRLVNESLPELEAFLAVANAPANSFYPWTGIKAGSYMCYMENRVPMPVQILDGQGDFSGQLMFRWFSNTIPGRLMHEMPKNATLIQFV